MKRYFKSHCPKTFPHASLPRNSSAPAPTPAPHLGTPTCSSTKAPARWPAACRRRCRLVRSWQIQRTRLLPFKIYNIYSIALDCISLHFTKVNAASVVCLKATCPCLSARRWHLNSVKQQKKKKKSVWDSKDRKSCKVACSMAQGLLDSALRGRT